MIISKYVTLPQTNRIFNIVSIHTVILFMTRPFLIIAFIVSASISSEAKAANTFISCKNTPIFLTKEGSGLLWSVRGNDKSITTRLEISDKGEDIIFPLNFTDLLQTNKDNIIIGKADNTIYSIDTNSLTFEVLLPLKIIGNYAFSLSSSDVIQLPVELAQGAIPFAAGAEGRRTLFTAHLSNREITSLKADKGSYSSWLRAGDGAAILETRYGINPATGAYQKDLIVHGDNDEDRTILSASYPRDFQVIGMDGKHLIVLSNNQSDLSVISTINIDTGLEQVVHMSDGADIEAADVVMSTTRNTVLAVGLERGARGFASTNSNIQTFSDKLLTWKVGTIIEARIVLVSEDADRIIARVIRDNGVIDYISWRSTDNQISILNSGCQPIPSFRSRTVTVTARDGVELRNVLITPPTKGPWPVVLYIHGGPEEHAGGMPNEVQLALVKMGFASLSVNYRGSAGRGIAFKELGFRQYDKGMVDDIEDSVSWLLKERIVRNGYVGVIANSFGGVLAHNLIRRKTVDLDSVVLLSSVYDIRSLIEVFMENGTQPPNSIRYFGYVGKKEDLEVMNRSSLLLNERTAYPRLLIIHGEDDDIIPIEQAKLFHDKQIIVTEGAELREITDMNHSSLPNSQQRAEIVSAITAFYTRELRNTGK
ncbi:MAG: alpha/beta hydrolase family protein [Niveispirillum sp.]|uniref:alpha/beta hydrolase family protein n=1 Tax=Niveispirillum sp. TaxID=1917217 RepID=UPI003BA43A97